jgi:hypothetical protein
MSSQQASNGLTWRGREHGVEQLRRIIADAGVQVGTGAVTSGCPCIFVTRRASCAHATILHDQHALDLMAAFSQARERSRLIRAEFAGGDKVHNLPLTWNGVSC